MQIKVQKSEKYQRYLHMSKNLCTFAPKFASYDYSYFWKCDEIADLD